MNAAAVFLMFAIVGVGFALLASAFGVIPTVRIFGFAVALVVVILYGIRLASE